MDWNITGLPPTDNITVFPTGAECWVVGLDTGCNVSSTMINFLNLTDFANYFDAYCASEVEPIDIKSVLTTTRT
jgi:hypothetical protein